MSIAVATSKQGMYPALAERCLLQTLQKAVLKRRASAEAPHWPRAA